MFRIPHVMALHQSDPLVDSLNHVARPVLAHSNLFSVAVQDGELFAVHCVVLYADRDVVRRTEDPVAHTSKKRLSARPLQTLYP